MQKRLPDGSVVSITPLEEKHVSRAADLLSVAFSEAVNAEVYQRFLRRQIVDYLMGTYKLESCVLVVALLHHAQSDTGAIPHLISSRLAHVYQGLQRDACHDRVRADLEAGALDGSAEIVGTGMVSFSPESRNKTFTLNPPPDQPYLTNMAVASAHQRKGIATLILQACEAATRLQQPRSTIHLQARQKDEPAVQLYLCAPLLCWCSRHV